jgi:hypothetical protein
MLFVIVDCSRRLVHHSETKADDFSCYVCRYCSMSTWVEAPLATCLTSNEEFDQVCGGDDDDDDEEEEEEEDDNGGGGGGGGD